MKWLREIPPMAFLAVVPVAFAVMVVACEPPSAEATAPDPPPYGTMQLTAQEADTFTVIATWTPVIYRQDTVRQYLRVLDRTDTSGVSLNDTIAAVGSETLEIPAPAAGATATYEYCLRSLAVNEADTLAASPFPGTCASFQYTSPVTFPPPPDSLDVEAQQTVAIDSVDVVPDSLRMVFDVDAQGDTAWLYTLAWHRGVRIDSVGGNQYQMRAELYKDGEIVGCAGACSGVVLKPARWDEQNLPVVLRGREGYPAGQEWMADRLPWLRELAAG